MGFRFICVKLLLLLRELSHAAQGLVETKQPREKPHRSEVSAHHCLPELGTILDTIGQREAYKPSRRKLFSDVVNQTQARPFHSPQLQQGVSSSSTNISFLRNVSATILPTAETSDTRPNIILLISDQLRHDFVGMHPHRTGDLLMPNVARLAREGVRFTMAFTSYPLCSPSRTALAVGKRNIADTKSKMKPPTFYSALKSSGCVSVSPTCVDASAHLP